VKPFDLEAAKRGEPLMTRDGRAVSEFHRFETLRSSIYSCMAIVDGESVSYTDGGQFHRNREDKSDLFMAPKKRTVFVNIYDKAGETSVPGTRAFAFNSEADARENTKGNSWGVLVVAHPVEIEE